VITRWSTAASELDPRLRRVQVVVEADVDNPLTGPTIRRQSSARRAASLSFRERDTIEPFPT
jgi:hypothetical protein